MPQDNAHRGRAKRSRGDHELHLFELKHHRPHEPRVSGDGHDPDGDHGVAEAGPKCGHQGDRQDQGGKREQGVDHAHQQEVCQTARVTADQADQASCDQPDGDRDKGDRKRDPGAPQDAADLIPSQLIRAQRVAGAQRRQVCVVGFGGDRVVG